MQPDILPYKEYLQVANYHADWAGNLEWWLLSHGISFKQFKNQVKVAYQKAGSPEDLLDDYTLCMNTPNLKNISKDTAFRIMHLFLYLY